MHGENRARFLEAMRSFRDWSMRVVASKERTDWVMPAKVKNAQRFVFSLDAYNFFAEHYGRGLRKFRREEELASQMDRYRRDLYKGDAAIIVKKTRFMLLPNRA
ncbi:MAG: hypothetical protein KGH78_05140 [Candidatus Micrarchaeota archaeon]|nr:hypothetical protein [Candidatus Micrarchaeota archaeon]